MPVRTSPRPARTETTARVPYQSRQADGIKKNRRPRQQLDDDRSLMPRRPWNLLLLDVALRVRGLLPRICGSALDAVSAAATARWGAGAPRVARNPICHRASDDEMPAHDRRRSSSMAPSEPMPAESLVTLDRPRAPALLGQALPPSATARRSGCQSRQPSWETPRIITGPLSTASPDGASPASLRCRRSHAAVSATKPTSCTIPALLDDRRARGRSIVPLSTVAASSLQPPAGARTRSTDSCRVCAETALCDAGPPAGSARRDRRLLHELLTPVYERVAVSSTPRRAAPPRPPRC